MATPTSDLVPGTPRWDVFFRATATVAGEELGGSISLQGGSPAVLALDEIPTIQVSRLFDQFCSSLKWPPEIFDLTLSQSLIFYSYVTEADPAKLKLPAVIGSVKAGWLYIDTQVSLTLAGYVCPSFSASVSVKDGEAFAIEGDLAQAVTLPSSEVDILRLSAPNQQPGGPAMSVTCAGPDKAFTLRCSMALFGTPFGEADMTVLQDADGGPPKLSATLGYKGSLGPFTDPSLSFTWSKKDGFQIQNFPSVAVPNVVLDFAKLLQTVCEKQGCGKLADFVLSRAMGQSFFAKPSVTTTKPAGSAAADGQLYVLIDGYYKITAEDTLVVQVDMPQLVLSLALPSDFSFDSIIEKIGETITDNAESVVKQLWLSKVQLGKFLAAFATQEVMKSVAATVAESACDYLKDVVEDFVKKMLEFDFSDLGSMLGGAAAAGGGCGGGGSHHDDDDDDDDDDGGSSSQSALATPAITKVSRNDTGIHVEWGAVAAAAGYEWHLWQHSGLAAPTLAGAARLPQSGLLVDIPFKAGAAVPDVYAVLLKALAPADGSSVDSAYAKTTLTRLTAPPSVSLSYDPVTNVLRAQWTAVPNAGGYEAQLGSVANDVFTPLGDPISGSGMSQDFPMEQVAGAEGGMYTVGVRATASVSAATDSNYFTSGTVLASQPLPRLAVPSAVQHQVLDDRLRAEWLPVPGARGYVVLVTNLDAQVEAFRVSLPPPASGSTVPLQCEMPFASFTTQVPGRHQVSVMTLGDATHLSSAAAPSPGSDGLFAGIGFMQVGSTFKIP
ncbi:MAG: hypothetical protein ACO1TE_28305 [Prosthecobacter sp.]